ncbi:hypothetical protein MTO96_051278 [Rhipicephalus appendiculatus]
MTRKKAKGAKPKAPLQQQLEQQAATAIGGWLKEKVKEATTSASRHSPPAPSTTAATSLALDEQVAPSPLSLSSDEGEMDTQCSRKRTRAGSDSDEPAGPSKHAVTIAAETPVLDDAADFRVVRETPASVPAAITLPPRKGRRRRRTRGHWTRPSSFLPHNIAATVPHPSPGPSGVDGDFVNVVSKAAQRRAKALEAAARNFSAVETGGQGGGATGDPREDFRDIVIGGLLTVLQAVIEYLPEALQLRDACLQAVNVPLNALQCT